MTPIRSGRGVKPKEEEIVRACDPGIRDLVAFLRLAGFETTDSGDGVAKLAGGDDDALPFPHVFIRSNQHLVANAHTLMRRAQAYGLKVGPQGHAGNWYVQAMYDPADASATLMLAGPNPR